MYQALRLAVWAKLTHMVWLHPSLGSAWLASIAASTAIYKTASSLENRYLFKAHGYDHPTTIDQMFLNHDPMNPSNVCGLYQMEQFEFEPMRDFLVRRISETNIKRWRCKVVDFLGK